MTYTLDSLAKDISQTLDEKSGDEAATALCAVVEAALKDDGFLTANIGADKTKPREILYEDADKGFCICVHAYNAGANSTPHDHGGEWAIYGQAEGSTEMTDWRIVKPGDGDEPALVEPERSYMLEPGMARYYTPSDIHSPKRTGATKLLRIEGANLDNVQRTPMKAADPATV